MKVIRWLEEPGKPMLFMDQGYAWGIKRKKVKDTVELVTVCAGKSEDWLDETLATA